MSIMMDFLGIMFVDFKKDRLEKSLIKLNNEGENNITKEDLVSGTAMISAAEASILLKDNGVKIRCAGRELTKVMLNNRVKEFVNGTLPLSYYQPSPFGKNWREYWLPILIETVYSIIIIVGTIVGTIVLYQLCEHFHHEWECQSLVNIFSVHCYVAKKSRSYLETYAYDIVYTTIVGVGVALVRIFMKMRGKVESHFK